MKSLLKKYAQRAGYVFGIAVAAIVVGVSLQFAKAWTEPSQSAPNGNVGAPITTNGGQTIKSGWGDWLRFGQTAGGGNGFFRFHNPALQDRIEIGYHSDGGVDSWSLMTIMKGGNVGIGTDANIKLAVGDNDTGLHSTGDGQLDIYSNNVNAMSIRSGNVGIGTSPAIAGYSCIGGDEEADLSSQSNCLSYGGAWTPYYQALSVAGSAVVTGNVGIGSTNPGSKLTVIGSSGLINSGGYVQHISGTDANTDPYRYMIGFSHGDSSGSSGNVRAGIGMMVTLGGAGNLVFETGFGNAQAERMRINGDGNVGIGTASPAARFQVGNGTVATPGTVSNAAGGNIVTGTGTQFTKTFKYGDYITIGGQSGKVIDIISDTSMQTLVFAAAHTNAAYTSNATAQFSVAENGGVSIGTASAGSFSLSVVGSTGGGGIYGSGYSSGVYGTGTTYGVYGGGSGVGVYGVGGTGQNGVIGVGNGGGKAGVQGINATGSGVRGENSIVGVTGVGSLVGIIGGTTSETGLAGKFEGDVRIEGDVEITESLKVTGTTTLTCPCGTCWSSQQSSDASGPNTQLCTPGGWSTTGPGR